MIILRVTKNQGFILSFKSKFFGKLQERGVKFIPHHPLPPPSRFRVKVFKRYYTTIILQLKSITTVLMVFLYVFLCFTSYIGGERFKDPRSLSNDEYPQPISLITTTDRIFMCKVKLSETFLF